MRKYQSFTLLFSLGTVLAIAQQSNGTPVSISIKNGSLLPQKVSLISYQPGETGNGTQIFVLMPGLRRKFRFAEGTKLYIANPKQVGTVMSGNRIDNEQPFLVVKQTDAGKGFKLKKRAQ